MNAAINPGYQGAQLQLRIDFETCWHLFLSRKKYFVFCLFTIINSAIIIKKKELVFRCLQPYLAEWTCFDEKIKKILDENLKTDKFSAFYNNFPNYNVRPIKQISYCSTGSSSYKNERNDPIFFTGFRSSRVNSNLFSFGFFGKSNIWVLPTPDGSYEKMRVIEIS